MNLNEHESELIKLISNLHICPFFDDPPVAEWDLDFILPYWTLCEHEHICLERNCPAIRGYSPKLINH